MLVDHPDRFNNIKRLLNYFKAHAKNDHSFLPEYLAVKKINPLVLKNENPSLDLLNTIYSLIKEVEQSNHYNGAGWCDYKMQIEAILKANGLATTL